MRRGLMSRKCRKFPHFLLINPLGIDTNIGTPSSHKASCVAQEKWCHAVLKLLYLGEHSHTPRPTEGSEGPD